MAKKDTKDTSAKTSRKAKTPETSSGKEPMISLSEYKSRRLKWIALAIVLFLGISYCSRTDRSEPPLSQKIETSAILSGQRVGGVLLPESARPTAIKAPIEAETPILEDGVGAVARSAGPVAVAGVLVPEGGLPYPASSEPPVRPLTTPTTTTPVADVALASTNSSASTLTSTTQPKYRPIDINSWYNKPHSNAYPEANEGYARWVTSEDQSFSGIPFFIKNQGDDIVAFSPKDTVVSRSVQMSGRTLRAVHIIYGCGWCGSGSTATVRLTTLDDQIIEKKFPIIDWSTGPNPVATLGSNKNNFSGNLYLVSIPLEAKNAETLTIIDDVSGPQLAIAALTIES